MLGKDDQDWAAARRAILLATDKELVSLPVAWK